MEIESADIIRLIQHHLTECGLHNACRALRQESGIGLAATHSNLKSLASSGRWGDVLSVLSTLDPNIKKNSSTPNYYVGVSPELIADVHEMAILELAEEGEIDLAFAALRLSELEMNRFSSIESRISTVDTIRKGGGVVGSNTTMRGIPPNYYGDDNISKQRRRDLIAKKLSDAVPNAPRNRLITLLQQAIKWQAHTGQLPMMERDVDERLDPLSNNDSDDNPRKKKKKRHNNVKSVFDIVLGEVNISSKSSSFKDIKNDAYPAENIPTQEIGKIKFGKKSQPQCALFLPDGLGLITGSSDGFVEVWDTKRWGKLRTHDLPYQKNDELMIHDTFVLALASDRGGEMIASGDNDGTIKVWSIKTGNCVREYVNAHSKAISCLAFNRDSSHILSGSHDSLLREFGLRGARMLKEFRGHSSYVNTCSYVFSDESDLACDQLMVVTSSADSTVRVWDGKTSEIRHIIRLPSSIAIENNTQVVGRSMVISERELEDSGVGNNIINVLQLHTPNNTFIVVPRAPVAYLMNHSGVIMKKFERKDKAKVVSETNGMEEASSSIDFVAATISPSNKWLYVATEDNFCLTFNTSSCEIVKSVPMSKELKEIRGLAHHPHTGILTSFSSDKSTRGVLKVWM